MKKVESILEAIFKTGFSSRGHGVLARLVIKFPLYILCYVSCFAWVSSTPHNFSEVDNIISERNQENKKHIEEFSQTLTGRRELKIVCLECI